VDFFLSFGEDDQVTFCEVIFSTTTLGRIGMGCWHGGLADRGFSKGVLGILESRPRKITLMCHNVLGLCCESLSLEICGF